MQVFSVIISQVFRIIGKMDLFEFHVSVLLQVISSNENDFELNLVEVIWLAL